MRHSKEVEAIDSSQAKKHGNDSPVIDLEEGTPSDKRPQ